MNSFNFVTALFFIFIVEGAFGFRPYNITKIVINTDPGSDDAMAILHTILHVRANPKQEILAITCSYGNPSGYLAVINALKTLDIAGSVGKIPVYPGAESNLLGEPTYVDHLFGDDAYGDFVYPNPPSYNESVSMNAVDALVQIVDKHPNEITLISFAPLTNIAAAQLRDRNFLSKLKNLAVMGGTFDEKKLEFNFRQDAEANAIIFNNTQMKEPILLLSLDMYLDVRSEVNLTFRKKLGRINNKYMHMLNKIDSYDNPWQYADELLAAALFTPKVITQARLYNVSGCVKKSCRGHVFKSRSSKAPNMGNTLIIEKINKSLLKRVIYETFALLGGIF